jgi:hypothetical protein
MGANVLEYQDTRAPRRLQQKEDLYGSGGYWMLRWHEDQIRAHMDHFNVAGASLCASGRPKGSG